MNGKAPYVPFAGSQSVEKTPDQPAVVNHVADCWVMLMAISDQDDQHQQPGRQAENLERAVTERPALRERGGGSGRGGRIRLCRNAHDSKPLVETVCLVTMLMLRGDLAELRLWPSIDVGRQRCVAQRCEQRLALLPRAGIRCSP